MKTPVDEWMARPYGVKVEKLQPGDGGGYIASIPELGELSFTGTGDTEAEAFASLRELQRYLFNRWSERGEQPPDSQVQP